MKAMRNRVSRDIADMKNPAAALPMSLSENEIGR